MFGLDNKSGINAMPPIAPADSQTPKWFTEGGAGLSATYPGQDWFNQIQAELLNILNAAGIAPQKGNLSQLSSAISKIASAYAVSIVHTTGTSLTSVMSQNGATKAFQAKGDYQPVGDYADKTSKELQEFKGGVRAPYIDAITGEDRTGFRMINKKAIIYSVVDGKVYQVAIPLRSGDAVLTDDLSKLPLIGSGSTRSGLTSSRELGVTYTNSKPYSIFVTVMLQSTARDSNLITRMRISDTPASNFYIGTRGNDADILAEATHSQLVLPGERYVVTSSPNSKIVSWVEVAQ